jgi:hypothetical protein
MTCTLVPSLPQLLRYLSLIIVNHSVTMLNGQMSICYYVYWYNNLHKKHMFQTNHGQMTHNSTNLSFY